MVNLEWYRSFIATYQAGTVTAAAARRFLTQPALSQHIAALEQALKTRLFERTARRMVPTDAAQRLYPKVVASIERLEAIEHAPLGQGETPWLRLGAPPTYLYERILSPSMRGELKDFRLEIALGETPELIERLKDDELDLVIATERIALPRLHYAPLQLERFVLVTPQSMPTPNLDADDPAQVEEWLSRLPWITYSAQMPIVRRYWQTVFRKRPDFEPHMIAPDLHAILRAIELGIGVSILPDYLLPLTGESLRVHTPWQAATEVSNQLYLVCQQGRARELLIDRTINSFREVLATPR